MSKNPRRDVKITPVEPTSIPTRVGWGVLVVLHLVCPLLFFTNLTRNPYYTQIALLNIGVCVAVLAICADFLLKKRFVLPRFPFEWPLALFLLAALASTLLSWRDHEFVRQGIVYEGVRVWVFTIVNCVLVLYLPSILTKPLSRSSRPLSIWTDILFAAGWGFMWFGFHTMKNPDPAVLLWDPYGGFLWILALGYGWARLRRGEALGVFHVIFFVSLIAGGYGILQYLGRDIIWSSPIQPYGGRPVSTFGNPNFMSSYLLMVVPLALSFSFQYGGRRRWGYAVVAAVSAVSILCTLTRSTYVGLAVALTVFGLILFRREHVRYLKGAAWALGALLLLILIFPATPVQSVQSPLERFIEIFHAIQSGKPYAPWHQRVLIWSSAWDMVRERFWLGKGWGAFELFYPFYQGGHLLTDLFGRFRTHANNAHNDLLELWAQTGLVGVGLSLWGMATLFWGGFKIFKSKSESAGKLVTAALLAGFLGMLTDNFFGNVSVFFAVPAFLFWWSAGALYNERDRDRVVEIPFAAAPKRIYACLTVLVLLGAAGSVYYFRRWKQEVFYFQGFKAAKAGQIDAAIKYLEAAVDWFPGEVNTNYELGNAFTRRAQILDRKNFGPQADKARRQAVDAYKLALAANPGYDEIYFNLGVTLFQLKKYDEAQRDLKLALTINPLLRDAYASLSNFYAKRGDVKKAGEILQKAVQSFPGDKDFWINLGYYYTKQGNNEGALDAYKKAYAIDPKFPSAWSNMRLAAQALGRKEPLVEFPSLLASVQTAVKNHDFAAALRPARKMVRLLPNNADARVTLGNVLFYLHKPDEAMKELREAVRLNPQLVTARLNLAEVYKRLGKSDEARREVEWVLKRDPKNERALQMVSSLQ